ncbi:MFS transporter [Roseibium salinum]|nr:MFS transporter [Roseibium salinum]
MGIGLMMPVMPSLLTELTSLPVSDAARWGGALSVVYALMQFAFGPTLGNLSDRFGRRPVLLVSMFTLAVDYLIMALSWHLAVLFVGRILSGVAGATFSAASAYIADVSSKADRAKNFGLVGAGFGFGFVLGPMIGGFLGEFGPRAPFCAAAALSFINFLFGYFMLPETLKDEKQARLCVEEGQSVRRSEADRRLSGGSHSPPRRLPVRHCPLCLPSRVELLRGRGFFAWSPGDIGLSLAFVGLGFVFLFRVI